MLGRDFEDEVRSRSVFELASNPIGYFGKMNSTLGSVVPLARFLKEAAPARATEKSHIKCHSVNFHIGPFVTPDFHW